MKVPWTQEQENEYNRVMIESELPLAKDVGYMGPSRELQADIAAESFYDRQKWKILEILKNEVNND